MNHIKNIGFLLWSALNIGAAVLVAGFTWALMSLHYDEMHTTSTAMDPNPYLTRDDVVNNVISQSVQVSLLLLVLTFIFWASNYAIYTDGDALRRYKRIGFIVFCACTFILFGGVFTADFCCLSKYPQHLPH